MSDSARPLEWSLPARIGPYAIVRKLGEGGMGVVYAARDERLQRTVALKTLSAVPTIQTRRSDSGVKPERLRVSIIQTFARFTRSVKTTARSSSSMELLEGQVLVRTAWQRSADQLGGRSDRSWNSRRTLGAPRSRGRPSGSETVERVSDPARGEGARFRSRASGDRRRLRSATELTRPGVVMGTPRYMAPEQMTGESVDARSDLFAVGAILFEMLAGRPAFAGRTFVEIVHATQYEQPPALTGSPAIAALDRAIRRALSKRPADRPASAEVMAEELRALESAGDDRTPALARALTRLVVLPFRILRPDPETDFLAFSLPDAISTSLSGHGSIVLRSSAVASRFAVDAPDLKSARNRSGCRRRGHGHAVAFRGSAACRGTTGRGSRRDLADVADRPVDAWTICFGCRMTSLAGVADALASAVDRRSVTPLLELRQMHARTSCTSARTSSLARTTDSSRRAICINACLEFDPRFAPAWAHLGRCHRVIGKFIDASDDSETRRKRRSAVRSRSVHGSPSPTSSLRISRRTWACAETVVRLLAEAVRHGNDPELFRRTGARVPLLRPVRRVHGRARRSAASRSKCPDQRRSDAAHDRRHRSTARHRAASRSSPAPTTLYG